VSEELADRDVLLAVLRELRPVGTDALVVVEQAPRVGEGHDHSGRALGGREHQDHRVCLPGLTGGLVAGPGPEVDHLLAVAIDAAGGSKLLPA
jgi:hypothetical protein